MTREMHDACNAALIVRTPGVLIAGYTDGECAANWANQHADVWISSVQTDSATIGDCEPGNGTVAGWIDWVQRRRSHGVDPSLYVADDSLSEYFRGYRWGEVRTAFGNAGVVDPHWWICKPGYTQIPDGASAVQAALDISPGYDYSVVADFWPGVDEGNNVAVPQGWTADGGDKVSFLTTTSGRVDVVHVGSDGKIYHRWKNQYLMDIAAQNELWGAPQGVTLVGCSANYDDQGQRIDVLAWDGNGVCYVLQMNVADGKVWNGWAGVDTEHMRVKV